MKKALYILMAAALLLAVAMIPNEERWMLPEAGDR